MRGERVELHNAWITHLHQSLACRGKAAFIPGLPGLGPPPFPKHNDDGDQTINGTWHMAPRTLDVGSHDVPGRRSVGWSE